VLVHRIDDRSLQPSASLIGTMLLVRSMDKCTDNLKSSFVPIYSGDHHGRFGTFLRDREAEIVILVEGTDDLTGSAIQTRHSTTFTIWPGTKPLFRAYIRTPVTGMVVNGTFAFPSFEGKPLTTPVCRLCTFPRHRNLHLSIATAAAIHYGMRRNREENL
jgi:hypothetical protein